MERNCKKPGKKGKRHEETGRNRKKRQRNGKKREETGEKKIWKKQEENVEDTGKNRNKDETRENWE